MARVASDSSGMFNVSGHHITDTSVRLLPALPLVGEHVGLVQPVVQPAPGEGAPCHLLP